MRHPRVEYPSKLRKWPLTWSCCGIGRHRTGERPKIVAAQGKNPLPRLKEAPPNPTAPACFLHSIGTRVSWTSRRTRFGVKPPRPNDAAAQTTRERDRRDRINQERRERTELIAEEERQRHAWLAANYEPPPSEAARIRARGGRPGRYRGALSRGSSCRATTCRGSSCRGLNCRVRRCPR